jgi:hypothetical protein
MNVDPSRIAVGDLARHLAAGYYAFLVAHLVATNPQSINSLPPPKEFGQDPTGEIKRKDGTFHTLNLRHYLDLLRTDQNLQGDFLRAWAMGALLTLGNELAKHRYFDHAPTLELVYHLRNGIAHGNRFNINEKGRKRLAKYQAHNCHAAVNSPSGTRFEVHPQLKGSILFDFMGAADVIDLLQSVEIHLAR